MGLLHDMDSREGIKSIMRTIDGYNYMMEFKQKRECQNMFDTFISNTRCKYVF